VFSRRVILTRWIAAIEFASTRVVILTTWIIGSEFAYGALDMHLALRLDLGPDPCRRVGRIMLKKNQLVKMTN